MRGFRETLNTTVSFFWDIAKIIIISLVIIIPIRYFIAQPFFVKGASMEPTYQQGNYLIVDEISYRFNEPHRGDVIIFRFPENTSQFFIKRIIALPSETIIVKDGSITIINQEHPAGFNLEEDYILTATAGDLEVRLDDNEYFVLGDNRGASYDSRRWGPLAESYVIGRVFLRAWPFDKFKVMSDVNYSAP